MQAFNTKFSLPSFLKQVKKLTDNQKDSIKRAGFGNLLRIPDHVLRRTQLFQLMEKWNSENQTFTFPAGELKITLLDVSLILGLRVTGQPVVLTEGAPLTSLEKEFGASVSNRALGIELLKERLESVGERDDESFVRVFLLYCFGTLLFPSVNGKVDSRYLCLLEDVDSVSSFAWGAAVLEDLHNCLTQRKSKKTNNIGGCLILIQIWCYEHILTGRPKLLDYPFIFPRVSRWESSARHYSMSSQYNINFEELEHTQILWKLEPTLVETEIDIIREIPQEWYLRSGPGTIEQPIEVESQSAIRSVTAHMEEVEEEEPLSQEKSTVCVISDDEESKGIEDLKKENFELKMIIEERKETEAKKRVEDETEIKELSKKVQDAEELGKRLQGENEELQERVQYEVQLKKTVQFENEELMKRVQDEVELRKIVQYENKELSKRVQDDEELRKRVQDEDSLRKRVQDENEELRKRIQDEEELRKHIQYENEELRKRVQDDEELRKRVQDENEELRKRVQDEDELRKRIQDENEKLRKRVQDEDELRRRIEDENGKLRKRVQDMDELRKGVQDENEELRKRVQDEEELRKRVQDENEALRKRVQDDEQLRKRVQDENEKLMKRVQDENEELRKRVQDEEELRKRVQYEHENLCDENKLMDGCISDLEKLFIKR
ncbi:uncharacterized protein LOC143560507 [Bidens hawaiensis]|uniref:uncharacterized protein LOC143560507 n=1 Tax=Bidens hawaiensis TaxID=980011 RepID=UPI00404A44FE